MTRGALGVLVWISLLGCGGARAPEPAQPVAPVAPPVAASATLEPTSDAVLGAALEALMASPFCEPDVCLDPFPLATIRRWDGRGGRVAFAGPGALTGVYADGRWDVAPLPGRTRAHDVAFAPDGTLFALGPSALYRRDDGAWIEIGRRDEGGVWSAILPRSATEIWIATTSGAVLRTGPDGVAPLEAQPRTSASDRIWASGGAIAVDGPYGGAIWDGGAWQVSVTPEELDAWAIDSGCGPFGLVEALFDDFDFDDAGEPIIPETPPLPPGPDRSPAGWIARVDPERRARFGPWVEHPPADIADVARDGDAWIAVGRSGGRGRMWARAGGELVTAELPIDDHTEPPSAVALRGEHAVVATGGTITRFDLRAPSAVTNAVALRGEDAAGGTITRLDLRASVTTASLPAGERATDVIAHPPGAIVLSASGAVYAIEASAVTRLHRAPRPLRALAADARRVVAVGDAGTIAVAIDGAWSTLDAGSSVDLRAVVLDREGAWAAGAAGTIVRVEGTAARVLPRVTYEPLVDVQARGEVVYGLSEAGAILRVDGAAWSRRARGIVRSEAALALHRWAPDEDGAWEAIEERLEIALDEPGAVMPYAMVRGRLPVHRYASRADEDAVVSAGVQSQLEYELASIGVGCCEGAGDDYVATLEDADECVADPWRQRCALSADPAYAIDGRRRRVLRIVETGPRDARYCAPLRIDVVRVAGARVERSSPVFDCARGHEARERAAWTWLAAPEQDAFASWEQEDAIGGADAQLHLHRGASTDVLTLVSRDNRTATTWVSIRRPRGRPAVDAWARVYHVRRSPDGDHTLVGAEIAGEHFVWVGRTPSSREPTPAARGDVASCESLVIADADGETNVRALPTSDSELVGVIPNGTVFRARDRHRAWIELTAPIAGWVFRANVACSED